METIEVELSQMDRRARRLLTADEVAEILGVSRRTVYRLANAGRLERVRFGYRTVRYPPRAVQALMTPLNESSSLSRASSTERLTAGVDGTRDSS